jgi:hypothetical protein
MLPVFTPLALAPWRRAEIPLLRVAQPDQRDGGFGRARLAPEIERTVAASMGQILSDRVEIAAAASGLAENRLPAIFAAAEG